MNIGNGLTTVNIVCMLSTKHDMASVENTVMCYHFVTKKFLPYYYARHMPRKCSTFADVLHL